MTPEQLARDAIRVTNRVENQQVRDLRVILARIERDARGIIPTLPLRTEQNRVFIELQTRQTIAQSRALQELLQLGSDTGPLATQTRARILASYQHGLETARTAAIATGAITAGEAASILAFGPRVDLDFIDALTRSTLTTLEAVGQRGLARLEQDLIRTATSGAGPRAAGRVISQTFDIARHEGERIARTTFMNANNVARSRMYEDLGVEYVQGNATNDERTCDYCESRHGIVYELKDSPEYPAHANCRCVLIPWSERTPARLRGDEYYEETRASMRERREDEGRPGVQATTQTPFERANGVQAPTPVWAPGRGWL